MCEIIEREPKSSKCAIYPGQRFTVEVDDERFSVQAMRHYGFAKSMAVWEFRCSCGTLFLRRASHVKHAARNWRKMKLHDLRSILTCGCQRKKLTPEDTAHPAYKWWLHRRDVKKGWPSFAAFRDGCFAKKDGDRLRPRDPSKPLSPSNFRWVNRGDVTKDRLVAILVAQGVSPREARARANRISRQRIYQLIHQAEGRCAACGQPRERLAHHCDRCAEKNRKRVLKKYHASKSA